jgi:hypothetical protein
MVASGNPRHATARVSGHRDDPREDVLDAFIGVLSPHFDNRRLLI